MVKTLPALLILVLTGLSGAFSHTLSQTDTEFWFVAPEVWAGHGDFPILLRFATFDEAAVITVEQPANPNFPTQTLNVDANSIYSLDLTTWLSQIENKPANSILNFGFHITSNSPITAYYEVNRYNNPDIFALKGSNALGLDFVVPFQMFLNNGYTQSTSSFDIVATEDGTVVTITPQKPIIGHPANVTFSITLNEGQTWSGRATSVSADQHPSGTTVTSNKPIAITMSDDSVNGTPYGGCADIMGDQIVPVNLLGTEYIAIKGNLNGPDKVFIVTTEPGTTVSVNGNLETTLPAASSMYTHTLTEPSAYYTTNHPVYVLHLTGFGCEIGGALLPPIVCTGSQEVAFVRSTDEFIGLKILVPSGGEGDFTFNGNTTNIMADDFSNVPGTEGLWKFANITATSFVPTLQASRLTNSTANFHLGIINGGASSGTRYGYFSNYAVQFQVEISSNYESLCVGSDWSIVPDQIIGDGSWVWELPNGTISTGYLLELNDLIESESGWYLLGGNANGCVVQPDSIQLEVIAPTDLAFDIPDIICSNGDPIEIEVNVTGPGLWSATCGTCIDEDLGIFNPSMITDGSFEITYESMGACEETLSEYIEVTETPIPWFNSPITECEGEGDVQLIAELPLGVWNANCASCITEDGLFNTESAGTGNWDITYSLSGNCPATYAGIFEVTDNISSAFSAVETLCLNDEVYTFIPSIPGGNWSSECSNCISGSNFSPSLAGIGDQMVTYSITGQCGTETSLPITVLSLPDASFTYTPSSGCIPLFIELTSLTTSTVSMCQWGLVNATGVTQWEEDCEDAFMFIEEPGCYDLIHQVIAENGCSNSNLVETAVCVNTPPSSEFMYSPVHASIFDPFMTSWAIDSIPSNQFEWTIDGISFGSSNRCQLQMPDIPSNPFVLCLEVAVEYDCSTFTCNTITLSEGLTAYAPNAFTPDQDGINDAWRVVCGRDVQSIEVRVFDRWGNIVFETNEIDHWWLGNVQNGSHYATDGIYHWDAVLRDGEFGVQHLQGHVTLIR